LASEADGGFLGNAFHFPGKEPGPHQRLGQPHRRAGCGTPWVRGDSGAVPCRAMLCHARAGACAGAGEARLSAALRLLPDMFTAMWRVLSPAVATRPHGLASFLSPCLCSHSAPFNADGSPVTGMSQAPAQHGAQVGLCLSTPARGGGRPRCHEVCTASASPHSTHRGRACIGQLPPAPGVRAVSKQWVESRKRRMGNRIWLRRRRQPRPLGPFPFPAPESPSHSHQPRGCTEGTGMLLPGRTGA